MRVNSKMLSSMNVKIELHGGLVENAIDRHVANKVIGDSPVRLLESGRVGG